MTAIVGFTKNGIVYMAGDTLGANEWCKAEYSESKVFKNGEFLIGFTDTFRFGDLMEYIFKPPKRLEGLEDREYLIKHFIPELRKCLEENKYTATDHKGQSGNCLIGYRGNLYTLQNDFSILKSSYNYDSCGSGSVFCLGAMSILSELDIKPKQIVKRAIKAAIKHNPYVGGRITIEVLKS